ncbi:MAG: ABC transporter ATP-binding protein [Acidimicrobiales bacterium]|nr:ABC transporter ATP-binding protein [Acidimicrobiales bacterium]
MPVIEVSNLSIAYGDIRAVTNLSFTANSGEVLAVLGPNGAGKTSTVECLEGYRRPTTGEVRVLGLDPIADHALLVPQIGVMLQTGGVYPGIRVLEALELFGSFYSDPANPNELLERVGLTHRRTSTWRQLSGGEQQRLSLALALIGKPQVAFLDEPTAGIDLQGRQLVRTIVRELAEQGTCVVLTTHDLDEAERVCDRVLIIDKGHLITVGTPGELMAAGGSREIRFGAPAGIDVAALGKAMLAAVHEHSPGEYVVDIDPSPSNIAALTNWLAEMDLPLADIRAGRQSLEDVFMRMTAITGEIPAVKIERAPQGTSRNRQPRTRRRAGDQ